MLVHAGKYWTEDQLKIQTIHELKTTQKKTTTKNTAKQTTMVQSPFTTLGQQTRWTYSAMLPSPHISQTHKQTNICIKQVIAYCDVVMFTSTVCFCVDRRRQRCVLCRGRWPHRL